jgi:hypothetical protein
VRKIECKCRKPFCNRYIYGNKDLAHLAE